MSATQLSHLQEFSIAGFGSSGTIFASHSPRAAPPNPAFALPSPTATPLDGLTSHPVSVSVSDGSFVTPLASPLPSPMMSPLRGGQARGEGEVSPAVGSHWQQGLNNRAPSPSGIALCDGTIAAGCFLFVSWLVPLLCMQYCINIDVVVCAMLFISCVCIALLTLSGKPFGLGVLSVCVSCKHMSVCVLSAYSVQLNAVPCPDPPEQHCMLECQHHASS